MAEHSTSLEETWRQVVEDLLRLSEQPDSGIPTLNGRARGFLKLVKPIALFNGFAVLSTPHAMAKDAVEKDLGGYITTVLSERKLILRACGTRRR